MFAATQLPVPARPRGSAGQGGNPASSAVPFGRSRALWRIDLGLLAVLLSMSSVTGVGSTARAQNAGSPPARSDALRRIGQRVPSAPCVVVEIAGARAGHLDCATQILEAAARIAQERARADLPVPQAGSPDVQVGGANQTAARLRMGNALGRSVHPERPLSRPPRGDRP
jgi:hypothetical protein